MLSVKANLFNKFFTESINVYRRTYTINSYGENVLNDNTVIPMTASVQPTNGKELQFLPDFALLTETVTIFTIDMLNSEESSGYSDIVEWNGNRYQVIKSKKWKTHCESYAVLEPLSE